MRIAFHSPRPSHLELEVSRGGDPVYLHNLFDALRRRGHEIEIVSRLDTRGLWRGRVPARRLLREAFGVRHRMKRFSPDAWLVYDSSRTYPDLFGWWQRPRRYVLLSAHTWQSDRLPRLWRGIFSAAHRLSLRRADRVIAVRPANAERLRRQGVPGSRLVTLPPAVPVADVLPTRGEARRWLGLSPDATVVLCISRLTERGSKERKTEIVLELMSALPSGALLVVVGDGPGRPEVERRAASLLPGTVRMFPPVRNDELGTFFAACDIYAYPDLRDLPRLSVLEAQAAGRPVVTVRSPSAAMTVDDGRTGVLAEDLDDFPRRLAALAADPGRREEMGSAARKYVSRAHSIDVRAEQIEHLLSAGAGKLSRSGLGWSPRPVRSER